MVSAGHLVACVALAGVSLLLTSCQTEHPVSAPPPPPPVVAVPVQPSVQPRVQSPRVISPAAWRTEANRWLSVKYRKGGTDRSGIDCSGLTSAMYLSVAGLSLPRLSEDQFRCGNAISFNELRPGDLVFFVALSQRVIDHVGIYLGETQFVHASASKGVVVSSLRQDYYFKRFHGAKRMVEAR
jgi:cell wall-associated NlpC family hydrolase